MITLLRYPLQAYNYIHKFDIICLSETYLENSYHSDDDKLGT